LQGTSAKEYPEEINKIKTDNKIIFFTLHPPLQHELAQIFLSADLRFIP